MTAHLIAMYPQPRDTKTFDRAYRVVAAIFTSDEVRHARSARQLYGASTRGASGVICL